MGKACLRHDYASLIRWSRHMAAFLPFNKVIERTFIMILVIFDGFLCYIINLSILRRRLEHE